MNVSDFFIGKNYYKKLYKLLYFIHNIFIKFNIQYWAIAGTLIGAIRHKGIIPWDDDGDLAVWKSDIKKISSKKVLNEFKKYGITVKHIHEWDGSHLIKIFYKSTDKSSFTLPFVDIFPMRLGSDKVEYSYKWARELFPKEYFKLEELYPLKLVHFGSQKILVPNSKSSISRMYGKSWIKKGLVYQSHYLGLELEKPIIVKGKFKAAQNFYSNKKYPLLIPPLSYTSCIPCSVKPKS